MGAGAAVVSTPYWHAQELLADGRGRLFPFKDHAALSRTLLELCGSPTELQRVRDAAFEFTHSMAWPRIGDTYFEIIRTALRAVREARAPPSRRAAGGRERLARAQPRSPAAHDRRYRHHSARHLQRAGARTGYCVDDNARALIVAVHADRVQASPTARALVTKYLSYLHCSQETDGIFRNFMSYDRSLERAPASDDCIGRALWALGCNRHARGGRRAAGRSPAICSRARLPHARRARAARHGAGDLRAREHARGRRRDSTEMRSALDRLVEKLAERYRNHAHRASGAGSNRRSPTTTPFCRSRCSPRTPSPATARRCESRASRSSFSRTCASTAIACSSSATRVGTAAAARRRRPTSRPSTRRLSCSRSAARTR